MRINAERKIVQKAVERCLNEIVQDIDNGFRGKFIPDEFELSIARPEVIYNSVYNLGIAAATESFTNDLMKEVYGRI